MDDENFLWQFETLTTSHFQRSINWKITDILPPAAQCFAVSIQALCTCKKNIPPSFQVSYSCIFLCTNCFEVSHPAHEVVVQSGQKKTPFLLASRSASTNASTKDHRSSPIIMKYSHISDSFLKEFDHQDFELQGKAGAARKS